LRKAGFGIGQHDREEEGRLVWYT